MLGNPSLWDFERMVHGNMISTCPIIVQDVANAYKMFGPNLADVRRKTEGEI